MHPIQYFYLENGIVTPYFNSSIWSHLKYLQNIYGSSRMKAADDKSVL